jgi:DNA polymerase-1
MREPNCADCPFGDEPAVPGLGTHTEGTKLLAIRDDRPFDLVCVAMAPAEEELRMKMPMVGPSGLFGRKIFSQLGIVDYWLTNCLLCPIPRKQADDYATIQRAVECCRPRLEDEIMERHPKLILAMGDLPLQELCGKDYAVKESEGRLLMSRLGVPLVPVAHPAFYLRRPDDAFDFIECTRAGVRYLQNNYHQAKEVSYVNVAEDNIDFVLEELNKHEFLSLDLETTGLNALGLTPDTILELGLSWNDELAYIIPLNLIPRFKEVIETKKIVGWNIFFDARFLMVLGIIPNIHFDGMLAHYCLDERQSSHGLKKVARVYLGATDWESNIKEFLPNKDDSYALIPEAIRNKYQAHDVCHTFQLFTLLEQEVRDNWAFWNILMPAIRVFTETLFHGILIDPQKMVDMYKLLWEDIGTSEQELWVMAGHEFNPASPKEVSAILYDELKVPMDPRSGRSTNKKILEKFQDDYEFIEKLVLHREMLHDVKAYVTGFAKRIDHDFRVHPSIKLHGSVTGRISSENPSVMNIKRDGRIKELFRAGEGKYLAEFDLKGAELRWYVIYSDDDVLRDILVNGYKGDLGFELSDEDRRDPHFMIGAIAYGPERARELRVAAKMTVFGRLYLRGLASIERQYGTEIARKLVSTMDEIIPKHSFYTKMIRNQIKSQGYVESYFKRQRRFPLITQENRGEIERQAVNMPIQSASSDLNILNLIFLWKNRHKWNVFPLFTVHDSILIEFEDPAILPVVKKAMEQNAFEIVKGKIPFIYDAKWGPNWGTAKKLKE